MMETAVRVEGMAKREIVLPIKWQREQGWMAISVI